MRTTDLNRINNTLAAEAAQVQAEAKRAADEAAIATAQPKTILDMINDIYDGKLLIITDNNDNIVGINCPAAVKGISNTQKIGSHMVMGESAENMHEDEIALKQFMKSYEGQNIQHMFYASLLIKNAGLRPEYAELINETYYFVINSLKKVIDENGNTIIDVSTDITGDIDGTLLTNILVDKLHLIIQENHYEDDDYDDYDEELPGDSYDRGYEDGYEVGIQDGREDIYEDSFFVDENASENYKDGYIHGYEEGFDEGQAELEI